MSNIKRFNEDWEGDSEEVDVPGYGKWPQDEETLGDELTDDVEEDSWANDVDQLWAQLNQINFLFDEGYLNPDGSPKVDIDTINSALMGEWEKSISTEEELQTWFDEIANMAFDFGSKYQKQ